MLPYAQRAELPLGDVQCALLAERRAMSMFGCIEVGSSDGCKLLGSRTNLMEGLMFRVRRELAPLAMVSMPNGMCACAGRSGSTRESDYCANACCQ